MDNTGTKPYLKLYILLSRYNFICFLIIFLTFPSSLKSQPDSLDWRKVVTEIQKLLTRNGSVGASFIAVNREHILYAQGFGFANSQTSTRTSDSTLFVLGSITKTFTALGIMKLIDEGKLNLNDRVKEVAPELPVDNEWEIEFPVRVYHLLEHTSGFDELHLKDRSYPVRDDEFPLFDGIQIVKNSLKTRWKPGSRFAYSNAGYLVAGYLIEKISGLNYNDFIYNKVLMELGMVNSSVRLKDINVDLLARSYSYNKEELPFKHVFTRPTASLIGSTKDIGQFLQMLLNNGEGFIGDDTFRRFEEHHSIDAFKGTQNGYRIGIYPRFYNGITWFGHGGSINKYNSEFEYSPELGLGVFAVSNGPNATRTVDGIMKILHNTLMPDRETRIESDLVERKSNLGEFSGYYVLTSPRRQLLYPFTEMFTEGIFVDQEDDKLTISRIGGENSRLFQTGKNTFSYTGSLSEFQYVFDHSNPQLLYTSLGFSYERKPVYVIFGLAGILIISLFFISFSQLFLLIRIFKVLSKKMKFPSPQLTLEIGASTFLIGCILFLLVGGQEKLHEPNLLSIALLLCTVAFPIITSIGILHLLKKKIDHTFEKVLTIGLSISMVVMNIYLAYWGFIGFAVWKY